MNDSYAIRRRTDLEKLKGLQTRMPRTLEILGVKGDPPQSIKLRINIPTANSPAYPREKQSVNEVEIQLLNTYPFPPGPTVVFSTPIWNPNVYPSGRWCYGEWTIIENLELFVLRLMKVIALDPTIINTKNAANVAAGNWYVQMQRQQPALFPIVPVTDLMVEAEKPRIAWRTIK